MPTDKLNDARVRAAKPSERAYKLFDGAGLALVVLPTGVKSWRLFYRVDGRQQTKGLGQYPEVGLAEARRLRDAARSKLRAGEPLVQKRSITVKEAGVAYWGGRADLSASYLDNARQALEMHVYPRIGQIPVGSLARADVMEALIALDSKGKHQYVRKVRMWLSQVLEWCVERGDCQANLAASIRPEKAFGRSKVEHHASLELTDVPAFWQRLQLEGELDSARACKLLAYTWVRTGELRMMRWAEIEGDLWRIPAGKMKRRRDHLVPLSRQALEVLARIGKRGPYVFPAPHREDRPMSENAVLYLIHRMGFKGRMTGHGFRTIGSTWAHEAGYPPEAIERQLAHSPENKVASVYNRAQHIDVRRSMLQAFSDWISSSS
jgi:integrase